MASVTHHQIPCLHDAHPTAEWITEASRDEETDGDILERAEWFHFTLWRVYFAFISKEKTVFNGIFYFKHVFATNCKVLPYFHLFEIEKFAFALASIAHPLSISICAVWKSLFHLKEKIVYLFFSHNIFHHLSTLCRPLTKGRVAQCRSPAVSSSLQVVCWNVIRAQHGKSTFSILSSFSPCLSTYHLYLWEQEAVPTFLRLSYTYRDTQQHLMAPMFWASLGLVILVISPSLNDSTTL